MATSLNDKYEPIDRYKAVVEHGSGLLVVSAGPGTGKTYSLLRKIERLIKTDVDPAQIYYLTFVNSIVDAFKADIRKPKEQRGLGIDTDDLGIHISTLHSLAFKVVKVYSDQLGLPSHIEVIDLSPKPQSVLSQVFVGDLYEYSKYIGIVENRKTFYRLLRQLTEAWRRNTQPAAECEELEMVIALLCRKYSVCPWDQLVLLAIEALTKNGLPTWLQGVQHFMIDEYQDFSPAEQRLLGQVYEPCDSVTIVGDPDQSIYSGRSASPEGLTDLLSRDDVECVNFVYCYRCPKKVLAAANNVLRFMDAAGYADKELQPYRDDDGDITITSYKSCKAEVEQIAGILEDLDESHKADTVILLPQKKIADYYAMKLCELGVDCSVKASDMTAELLLAALRLTVLHYQPFLHRVILSCFPNVERKYRSRVVSIFLNGDDSLSDTLKQASVDQNWQKRLKDPLSFFAYTIEKLASGNADSIIAGVTGLNLEVSKNVIDCLLASDEDLSARERVELSLRAKDEESEETTDDAASIQVMTMHSSKGLSKQLVIIPAFDEKLLPGNNTGERLAETHRLIYVAVTRAKGQVLITFPRTRAKGDPLNYGAKPEISTYRDVLLPPSNRQ